MDDALDLIFYLPISYKSPKEQEYMDFLWDAFRANYEREKYQFAFLAYHMLTMSFVYFNIWQIAKSRSDNFKTAMIGFTKDEEKVLLSKDSPFNFSKVRERTILRLLRLIACDDAKIGAYAKLVDNRNETAHSNGNIYYSTSKALDLKIAEVLRIVDEIEQHSKCVIEQCYRDFLLASFDPEDRQYPDPMDQIREILVQDNYFSQQDIDICIAFDITSLESNSAYSEIVELHKVLCEKFKGFGGFI